MIPRNLAASRGVAEPFTAVLSTASLIIVGRFFQIGKPKVVEYQQVGFSQLLEELKDVYPPEVVQATSNKWKEGMQDCTKPSKVSTFADGLNGSYGKASVSEPVLANFTDAYPQAAYPQAATLFRPARETRWPSGLPKAPT